jgi:hypothetical protein
MQFFSLTLGNERSPFDFEATVSTSRVMTLVRLHAFGFSLAATPTDLLCGLTYGAAQYRGLVESFATVGPVMATVTLPARLVRLLSRGRWGQPAKVPQA